MPQEVEVQEPPKAELSQQQKQQIAELATAAICGLVSTATEAIERIIVNAQGKINETVWESEIKQE